MEPQPSDASSNVTLFSSPPSRIARSAESLGRFALTTTFRANGHDCIVSSLAEHGASPKDFLSTVDDFQEHIDDDGWWIHVTQIEPGKIEITPAPEFDPNATNQEEKDTRQNTASKSPSKPQLHGRVPLKGQISCSLEYYAGAAGAAVPSRPVTVLELPFDDYEINLTVADKLTRKRKRDDAVHTLYHVDQLRRPSGTSDLLVLLFSTMPSGEYFLEAIRLFVPLKLLPPDFAAAAAEEIENQRRQRSARKKIKFNGGAMEKVHLFFGKAPPAFRVEHPEAEFDTTLKAEDVESLDFAQLKTECKSRGINASGKKSELASKLRKHLLLTATTTGPLIMQLDFSDAALQSNNNSNSDSNNAVSSSHSLFVPPSPMAPTTTTTTIIMPSPSAKNIKSALKAKPAVFPEPPAPTGAGTCTDAASSSDFVVVVPKRLDFSSPPPPPTAEVASEPATQQSQPQSPAAATAATARAKRARRSSLALAGLPDFAEIASLPKKPTEEKKKKEEEEKPKSPAKRQPTAAAKPAKPAKEQEKPRQSDDSPAPVQVPVVATVASPRRSTRRSSLLLPNPPRPV